MNNYFYIDANGQQCGPVAGEELKNYGLTKESLVWCEGMSTWEKAGSVPELSALFVVAPPTPPTPPTPTAPQPDPALKASSASTSSSRHEVCPNNNMVWAILVTLMCCWPFGIPAIVNASKVESLWYAGRKAEAIEKAESAKKWCWVAAICGIVWAVIYFVLMFAIGVGTY